VSHRLAVHTRRVLTGYFAGDYDTGQLLTSFRRYVGDLGAQPVTLTVTSMVRDMINIYGEMREHLSAPLSWEDKIVENLEEFVLTRECWHFHDDGREPSLDVTFTLEPTILRASTSDLELNLHFAWCPPVIEFRSLKNVVDEDDEFLLNPAVSTSQPFSVMSGLEVEYYVGPSVDWLH
jgi:hypothetical protein